MATNEQKEELIEILKFTPRTYTVRVTGYGGEIVMGRVDQKVVDYFRENRIDLEQYASSWSEPGDDDYVEVPEEMQPFSQGNWYDCDNIEHCSGAEFGGAWLIVEDENGKTVLEVELDNNLEDLGCEIECFCEEAIEDHCTDDEAVFVGQNFEKGSFFEAELELRQPFDTAKLKFVYSELAGWPVLNIVEYDGEELDGSNGYDTTGKSSSYNFYYKDQDGEIQEYSNS